MEKLTTELKLFLKENATLDDDGKIIELKSINKELKELTFQTLCNILHYKNPLLKQEFEIQMQSMADVWYIMGHETDEKHQLLISLLSGKTKYERIWFKNKIGLICYVDYDNEYIILEQDPPYSNYSYQRQNERIVQFTEHQTNANYTVKLSPWSYMIYKFYLNHPEGVSLKNDAKDHIKELIGYYEEQVFNQDKIDSLKDLINNKPKWTKTINNKITELNTALSDNAFPEALKIKQDERRANNQIFYIPYYRKQFIIQNLKKK